MIKIFKENLFSQILITIIIVIIICLLSYYLNDNAIYVIVTFTALVVNIIRIIKRYQSR